MSSAAEQGVHAFEARTLAGAPLRLADFAGKVLLIVNTASRCGFTPQYAGLQTLHDTYGPRGLVVIGFPCNQFGAQEPGGADEIAGFCQRNYNVGFIMADKVEVNGKTYTMPLIGGSAPAYTDTWREAFAAAEAGGQVGA